MMLTGDNGILTRAAEAKERVKRAEIEEKIKMAVNSAVVDGEGKITYDNLVKELDIQFTQQGYTIEQENDDEWIITVDDVSYKVSVNGGFSIYDGDISNANKGTMGEIGNTDREYYVDFNTNYNLDIPDITDQIDGLPSKKTHEQLTDYIPIYTPEQFRKIASEDTNYEIKDLSENTIGTYNMNPNAKYALMNDLDFSGIEGLKPIKGFKGIFEGNGCTIKNVNIDTSSDKDYTNIVTGKTNQNNPAGLFECINGGSIQNLAVTNSTFISNESAAAIAGQADGISINNCYVKDCTIASGGGFTGASAGIVGFLGNDGGTINNCKVIHVNGSAQYFAGIVSTSEGFVSIGNCQVVNGVNTYLSGIMHCATKSASIGGCKVQNITVRQSGILGAALSGNELNIGGCTAKNITLEGASSASGILDFAKIDHVSIQGCKVQNIIINSPNYSDTGKAVIARKIEGKKTEIKDCEVANVDINSTGYFGTIVDHVFNDGDGIKIENCKVYGVGTTYNANIREAFGGIARNINSKYSINGCIVNDIKINMNNSDSGSNSYTNAGVIGFAEKEGSVSNCRVNKVELTGKVRGFSGVVGWTNNRVFINNCNFTNSSVTSSTGNEVLAGIYASGFHEKSEINNCKVSNVKFNIKNGRRIAGIVGGTDETSIYKCNVDNLMISSEYSNQNDAINVHYGGIAGIISSNSSIKECNVNNITIDVKNGKLGGISAHNNQTIIENCKVSNSVIKSQEYFNNTNVGGICGFGYAKNCTVENTLIDAPNYDGVGGIVGHSNRSNSTLVQGCNVIKTTINGRNHVGGICGAAAKTISGCTVTDSIISASEENAGGIQGLAGILRDNEASYFATIENCNVNHSSIKGKRYVDYIQGRNSCTESGNSNDKIINCKHNNTLKKLIK